MAILEGEPVSALPGHKPQQPVAATWFHLFLFHKRAFMSLQ
jgi:hypothetical protein